MDRDQEAARALTGDRHRDPVADEQIGPGTHRVPAQAGAVPGSAGASGRDRPPAARAPRAHGGSTSPWGLFRAGLALGAARSLGRLRLVGPPPLADNSHSS